MPTQKDTSSDSDALARLTIVQAAELKNYLKTKYGIEPVSASVLGGGDNSAAPAAAAAFLNATETTEFDVILEGFTDKLKAMKAVRELTGQGLGEAKRTVESAPKAVKENVDKKTADDIKKKLEESGVKVTVMLAGEYFRQRTPTEEAAGQSVNQPRTQSGNAPADEIRSATFRAMLLAHFQAARDMAISNLARPQG